MALNKYKCFKKARIVPSIFCLLAISGCLSGGGSGSSGSEEESSLPSHVEEHISDRLLVFAGQDPQTNPAPIRSALRQLAKTFEDDIAMHSSITSGGSNAAISLSDSTRLDILKSGEAAVRCLIARDLDVEEEVSRMSVVSLNTTVRYTAYRAIDMALAGTFSEYDYSSNMESSCER